jgi:acyl-CoA dehydrogenase
MDFDFPPDTLMLRDMLRRFVQKEARPLEMEYFNRGELSVEARARLRRAIEQLGLWGAFVPEQLGGGGLDQVTACLIEEELGGTFIPVELGNVTPLLYACAGEQISRFLEPALAGERQAVLAAREPGRLRPEEWTARADPDQEGWVLQGQKSIALRPAREDFLIVFTRSPQGMTAFLLEPVAGMQVCPAASEHGAYLLNLQGVRVGGDAILGDPGQALTLGAAEAPLDWVRLGARYVGIAGRLAEMAAAHAREWVSLGAPLAARPAIRQMLVDLHVDVAAARWMVYHAAWLADAGQTTPLRQAAAQVRLFSGEMLQRAVDRVTMIFTGPGPSPQIEAKRLVGNLAPPEVLEFGIEQARAMLASGLLSVEPRHSPVA